MTIWHRAFAATFFLCLLVALAACTAQFPVNPKTAHLIQAGQKDPLVLKVSDIKRSESLLFFMTFSGGGTRAAALSYGILEALDRVEIPVPQNGRSAGMEKYGRTHPLLDEVDIISSVSGGSFTSAYYGLHGRGIFKDYRDRFLLENFQGQLLAGFLNPFNWFRIGSPHFGRSDLAEEYYDEMLFNGATLGDLYRSKGPSVLILATDVTDGFIFGFSPSMFSLICSDYNKFPVARAVAASAAFPGPLSPIVLKNYAGQCAGSGLPDWMQKALERPETTSRAYYNASRMSSYLNPKTKPYIYLVDGGVSDNLGIRGPLEAMIARGHVRDLLKDSGFEKTQRVVFLIVDAQTQEKSHWKLLGEEIPGLTSIVDACSTIMINKYNFETIELLHRYAQDWTYTDKVKGQTPIDIYIIHVTFDALPDKAEREYFHKIPTSLSLSAQEVDKLRDVAGRILYADENFQRLVKNLGGAIPGPPPASKTNP